MALLSSAKGNLLSRGGFQQGGNFSQRIKGFIFLNSSKLERGELEDRGDVDRKEVTIFKMSETSPSLLVKANNWSKKNLTRKAF